jgi:hypothetical protein
MTENMGCTPIDGPQRARIGIETLLKRTTLRTSPKYKVRYRHNSRSNVDFKLLLGQPAGANARCTSRIMEAWCPGAESNHRHRDFQSRALPTELPGRRASPAGEVMESAAGYRGSVPACPGCWCGATPRVILRVIEASILKSAKHLRASPPLVLIGPLVLQVVRFHGRHRVGSRKPAMEINVGATPRAERAKQRHGRLATGRTGL